MIMTYKIIFFLVLLCFYAEAAKRVGTKKFAITQVCKQVAWDGYKMLNCKFDVEITGFPEYPFTKQDFFNNIKDYYFPGSATGTCFKADRMTVDGDTTDHFDDSKTLVRNQKIGFPDNIQCNQMTLSLDKAFHTTTNCRFLPKMGPTSCQSSTRTKKTVLSKTIEYDDVTKEARTMTNAMQDTESSTSSEKCDLIDNLKDYLALGYWTKDNCQDILKKAEKCKDKEYNADVWKSCTYSALKTVNADFMTPNLENLNSKVDDYCTNRLQNLKTCVDKETFCETPDKNSFYLYKGLYSHFGSVCTQKDALKKQQGCLSKIKSSQLKSAMGDFDKCFSEATKNTNDKCSAVQLSLLCRPLLLTKYAKDCSTFDELYQAEIDTRDWTECAGKKAKLDPCKTTLTARYPKCNGASALFSSSSLFVMVASLFFCVFY